MLSTTFVTKATLNPTIPILSTPSCIAGNTSVKTDAQHEKGASLNPAAPVQLSLHTAELVRIWLEQDLLREESRQSAVLRQMGWQRDPAAYTSPSGLDELAKSTISAFIRANKLSIADAVRRFRNETNHDSRPNKALDPARLAFLLKDYPHLSTLLEVVNVGITPVWNENEPRIRRTQKNHASFQRYLKASLRSIRMGQDTGRYLVVDADILDQWQSVHCSPFGAVEKGGVDPLLEIRLIHDLSYPAGTSTNDCLDKSCLPEIEYAYVTALAIRIEYLAINYPAHQVRILKGDVKGAYRHLMTNANHDHRMAGLIRELNTLVIDLAAPFGWSGSPKFYGVFGRAISWLVSANAPSTVANSADSTPFFGYEWVDDHVMIEPDVDDRLQLAEATLRHAMLAILGPRSVDETKFSSWETRLTVLGLTWDTKSRTVSIPQDKIDKGINRIDALISKGTATQTELNKVLGSLRYISTCLRTAKPFFQQLQSAATRWPRFGRIALTEAVVMDLRWFLHILRDGHLAELPLRMFGATPVPDFHLYMDASDTGLAVLHPARNEFLQIRFDAEEIDLIESGALSINVREHLCIALAVWTWGVHMAADSPSTVNHIRCWSDNTSAVAWSNRLASPCNEAQEINRAIGLGEAVFNIRMSAAHLPGATNRMADAASRAWSSSSTNLEKDLQDVLFKLQAESLAPTSTVKYASTWKQWEAWCTIMHFSPWLSDNRVQQSFQLALFAVYCWRYGFSRSGQGNSASTILSKISHLSWNHQINLGYSVGLLPGHKLAITGMRRHDRPSARKHPMSIPMLKALHRTLNFSITQDRVLWGAAVLGFFYLLRRSEYLAHGRKVQSYAITRDDVQVLDIRGNPCSSLSSASKVIVRFRGSKNDQFGEGTTRTLERSGSAWCCPVQAAWFLIHHHMSIGARADSLLCQVTEGQDLQVNVMVAAIKQAARSVGGDPRLFGSHSLRSGGATALFNAGVDSLAIKKFGRWRSEAVERYTTIQDDITASLAAKMLSNP